MAAERKRARSTGRVRLIARRKSEPAGPGATTEAAKRRPPGFDARAALVRATADLLRSADGAEPSVVEIARRADVNPGLIGYYFGSKGGLLLHLLTEDMEAIRRDICALIDLDIPVVEKMRRHISGLITTFFEKPYINHLILTLVRRGPQDVADRITEELMRPITDVHARLLGQGVASGELRPIDPMLFYFTILGACDRIFSARYSLTSLFGHTEVDAGLKRRFIDHTIAMLLPGLLADPAHARETSKGKASLGG